MYLKASEGCDWRGVMPMVFLVNNVGLEFLFSLYVIM